jgi:hypothetical protein
VLGISLSFSLVFSLTEFLNLGLCDKCCNTDLQSNPLIATKKQVFLIFSGSILMGAIFGILFGVIDVEDDPSRNRTRFKENLLWSIQIGAVIGGLFGFVNQWLRTEPRQYYHWTNTEESSI